MSDVLFKDLKPGEICITGSDSSMYVKINDAYVREVHTNQMCAAPAMRRGCARPEPEHFHEAARRVANHRIFHPSVSGH